MVGVTAPLVWLLIGTLGLALSVSLYSLVVDLLDWLGERRRAR